MVEDGEGRRKTAENNGKQLKTAGDGGGRWGVVLHSDVWGKFQKTPDETTECRPSSSFILTYRTGRQTTIRTGHGSGRTDCAVASTGLRHTILSLLKKQNLQEETILLLSQAAAWTPSGYPIPSKIPKFVLFYTSTLNQVVRLNNLFSSRGAQSIP